MCDVCKDYLVFFSNVAAFCSLATPKTESIQDFLDSVDRSMIRTRHISFKQARALLRIRQRILVKNKNNLIDKFGIFGYTQIQCAAKEEKDRFEGGRIPGLWPMNIGPGDSEFLFVIPSPNISIDLIKRVYYACFVSPGLISKGKGVPTTFPRRHLSGIRWD